jgi:CspA family cold shock protein
MEMSKMPRGTVKWFNNKKGFGFLTDPNVPGDVFVHYSEIQAGGYRTLEPGDAVEYELVIDQKGSRARSVVRV